MAWTEERVAKLRRLWCEEGLSCSAIASRLGGVTRNAVIGKVHRLGLTGDSKPQAAVRQNRRRAPVRRKRRTSPHVQDGAVSAVALPRAAVPSIPYEPDPFEPAPEPVVSGEPVTLMALTERTCKWPIGMPGEPGFRFCGQPSVPGRPYCEHHCRIAYQPRPQRRQLQAAE